MGDSSDAGDGATLILSLGHFVKKPSQEFLQALTADQLNDLYSQQLVALETGFMALQQILLSASLKLKQLRSNLNIAIQGDLDGEVLYNTDAELLGAITSILAYIEHLQNGNNSSDKKQSGNKKKLNLFCAAYITAQKTMLSPDRFAADLVGRIEKFQSIETEMISRSNNSHQMQR